MPIPPTKSETPAIVASSVISVFDDADHSLDIIYGYVNVTGKVT
jgi:hypothetical protein